MGTEQARGAHRHQHRAALGMAGGGPPTTNRGGFVTLTLPAPDRLELPACFPLAPLGVQFAGLHGVNVSLKGADVAAVRDACSAALDGLSFSPMPRGFWTYECRVLEPETGAFIVWTEGRADMAVSLTGTACEQLGVLGTLSLLRSLAALAPGGFRVTRLDVAWDTELFGVADVVAAYAAGDCVTRARKRKYEANNDGTTFYIGQRGEEHARLVRFYDKRGPTRCELELHGDRSNALAAYLVGCDPDAVSRLALGALLDFVDFRDVGADTNVTRCPRVSWWAAFTASAEALPLPVRRPLPTLDRLREWCEDTVSGSLSTIFDAMGEVRGRLWVGELLEKGRERRSPRQAALLDITQKVRENSIALRENAFYRH